jgi:hypothetical protein
MPKKISEEVKHSILLDFIHRYRERYGNPWQDHVSRNLRPSPIRDISERHGVSPSAVSKIRILLYSLAAISTEEEEEDETPLFLPTETLGDIFRCMPGVELVHRLLREAHATV